MNGPLDWNSFLMYNENAFSVMTRVLEMVDKYMSRDLQTVDDQDV